MFLMLKMAIFGEFGRLSSTGTGMQYILCVGWYSRASALGLGF